MTATRRHVILGGAAILLSGRGWAAPPLLPTPAQTEGPFYPDVMPTDIDPDLVKIADKVREAGGEVLSLAGRVLGIDGSPIEGAVVEIWQADATGHYVHTADRSPADKDRFFQGIGRARAGADGSYEFRTIRPVAYPGRTPHIHYKVYHPDGRVLTTQMYVAGEPGNARDGVYRSLTPEEQALVTAELRPGPDGFRWAARFDVVLPGRA